MAVDIVGHPGAPEWAQHSGPSAGRGLHDILVSAAKYHLHAFIYDFTLSSDTMCLIDLIWSYLSLAHSLAVKTGWTTKSVWGHKLRDSLLHRAACAQSNKEILHRCHSDAPESFTTQWKPQNCRLELKLRFVQAGFSTELNDNGCKTIIRWKQPRQVNVSCWSLTSVLYSDGEILFCSAFFVLMRKMVGDQLLRNNFYTEQRW